MKIKTIATLVLLIATVFAAGCSIKAALESNSLAAELAVRAATARVLQQHQSWIPAVISITADASALTYADPLISVADLEAGIVKRIPWAQLLPEEQVLVQMLINQVRTDLEDSFRAQGHSDPAAVSIRATQILQWINQTAERASNLDISIWEVRPPIIAGTQPAVIGTEPEWPDI